MRSLTYFELNTRACLLLALVCCHAVGGDQGERAGAGQVDLLGETVEQSAINCTSSQQDGVLSVELTGEDSLIDLVIGEPDSADLSEGPYAISFRMRIEAEAPLEEYLLYWVTGAETAWRDFVRVPIQPDGEWHEYRLPLSASKNLKALRLGLGKTAHRVQITDARASRLAPAPPELIRRGQDDTQQEVSVTNDKLTVSATLDGHSLTITDSSTGRVWRSEPLCNLLTVCRVDRASDASIHVGMFDRFTRQEVTASVEAIAGDTVKFTIEAEDYRQPLSGARFYPPRFRTEMAEGQIVFCDRSCGVLLDQQDTTYASWPMRVYGNTNCLDMPWIGVFDDQRGDGAMLLVETPADAEVLLTADNSGNHAPAVNWLPSQDSFGYARTASLRFSADDRHVGLAGVYRDYLKSQGRFKTLAQKAKEKPAVNQLRGAPSLWGGRYPTKFIRQMRPLGVDRGIVNTCKDPGLIRWLNDLGYLTGRYDSYTDFFEGPVAFQSDDVARAAIVSRPGGLPKHGWKMRSGRQMYWRSSAEWSRAEASYTPQELAKLPYNSRFVDVAAAAEPFEDYHPDHTIDRREDLANRRALFQKMNDYGLVLGTEHGNDWVADLVEYFEGTMSGPFWWSSWPAGYLDRPTRDQLSPNYLKYGMGYQHRVPLWELVFHDCANTTWYWGDTAGLLYGAAPELSDRKDLFNILYGTTPLFWMNGTGYRHPDETHRMLRTYHDTCKLHEVVAFEQMTAHEFLSDDRSVQKTRFSNGAEVVVNFSSESREYVVGDTTVNLSPNGYLIHGPDIVQSKLMVDGASQTVIEKPGYLTVESNGQSSVQGVKCPGRLTAFSTEENKWNLFVDPDVAFEINIAEVTGWDTSDQLFLYYMDDLGEARRAAVGADSDGVVRFRSAENAWRFALVRRQAAQQAEGERP